MGFPESPPSSLMLLVKLALLLFVVFVSIIAEISLFIATLIIEDMCCSSISGDTFNNKGILVFLFLE